MARLFNDGASDSLIVNSTGATAYPFAMACGFRSNDGNNTGAMMWCGDKDATNYFASLQARGSVAGDRLGVSSHNYGGAVTGLAVTSSGYTANIWHHAAGVWLSRSERHVYIDGGSKGSNTATVGATLNHDRTALGLNADDSPANWFSGDIAEAGVWDLTNWGANDAEREINFEKAIASMAKGFTPAHFPLGLVTYWPLIRGLNDKVGGLILTASGTTVSNHPRVIFPHGVQ